MALYSEHINREVVAAMRIICVDSDAKSLDTMLRMCRRMPNRPTADGFMTAERALAWAAGHAADVALLEFNVSDMDGIELARSLLKLQANLAIVFVTDQRARAIDAWGLFPHPGCMMKPIAPDRLEAQIERALSARLPEAEALCEGQSTPHRIEVKCFGGFDLLVDGRTVAFPRSKAKELLACLVDQRGNRVTRRAAFSTLWEGRYYDRSMQKYFDNVVRCLLDTLAQNGAREIVEARRGSLRICPEKLACDFYGFLDGDLVNIQAFRGEYMNDYSWASITEAFVDSEKTRKLIETGRTRKGRSDADGSA